MLKNKSRTRIDNDAGAAKRREWWAGLTQAERDMAMRFYLEGLLASHLRAAMSLAETYLEDGAPRSALQVLRDATTPRKIVGLGIGL